MPRQAREKSESGIYHIMLRGANRQEIFHDDEDCLRFLETISRYKEIAKINVHGWCLMGNHAHLLVTEGNEEISTTIKRIGVSYAWFYNMKYRTTGHLFQDRFKSEAIDDNKYLLTVIQYIHQNPVKAGLVKKPEEWKWSSCNGYYSGKEYPTGMLDREYILSQFSNKKSRAIQEMKKFEAIENTYKCMDDEKTLRLTDEQAREEIKKLIPGYELGQIKGLAKEQRDRILVGIKGIAGISHRQAARILGISVNLIHKA